MNVMYTGNRTTAESNVSTRYQTTLPRTERPAGRAVSVARVLSVGIVHPPIQHQVLTQRHDQRQDEQPERHGRAGLQVGLALEVDDFEEQDLGGPARAATRQDLDLRVCLQRVDDEDHRQEEK